MKTLLLLTILLPLAGSLLNMLIGQRLPRRAVETVACGVLFGSFFSAAAAFLRYVQPETLEIAPWLSAFHFDAGFSLYADPLSMALTLMITFVCALIHLYSVGYMQGDPGYVRYFALLNLFVFAMLVLVLAGNLPLLYLGWEGVGFCSYGLIGFWYREKKNADAGRKAFIVTRVGDVALLAAIVCMFDLLGTLSIPQINTMGFLLPPGIVTTLGFLLLAGAVGKSAQLPLTVWLPDAMAGPTPVSAQIHAATMVTAGVYLLARMLPLIGSSAEVLSAIAVVGGLTAFYGAASALVQRDIKRVLAYSTISQIGFMMLGVGAGSPSTATFHLLAHAFFKALLFLGAGCVIHAMHHEQDILRMGGLKKRAPLTYAAFAAGVACLAGLPPTGGFFSKDAVLTAAWNHGGVVAAMAGLSMLTAFITSVYSFRLLYLVFHGSGPEGSRPPRLMEYVLAPLALLGLLAGIIDLPAYMGGGLLSRFMGHGVAQHASVGTEVVLQLVATTLALAGWGAAHRMYGGERRAARVEREAASASALDGFFRDGWRLDALYRAVFVVPFTAAAGFLWQKVDEGIIDDTLDRVSARTGRAGSLLAGWNSGRMSGYLKAFAGGAAALAAYFAWILK